MANRPSDIKKAAQPLHPRGSFLNGILPATLDWLQFYVHEKAQPDPRPGRATHLPRPTLPPHYPPGLHTSALQPARASSTFLKVDLCSPRSSALGPPFPFTLTSQPQGAPQERFDQQCQGHQAIVFIVKAQLLDNLRKDVFLLQADLKSNFVVWSRVIFYRHDLG